MKDILRAENITKAYGEKQVLSGIDIYLREGELVGILGASGVGKTTLFNVLSGLVLPDAGQVFLEDNEITGKNGYLSYMLQKDMLLPHKRIVDNVALPLTISGMARDEARERALKYFSQFGLSGYEYKYPSELSGGMRQRAAFLRTYLCDKKVALLDEPFSSLDTLTRASIEEWYLKVMREIKLSTLFITHDIDEAILLSDRIYVLKGSPATISMELTIDKTLVGDQDFTLSEIFLEYKRQIKAML